MVPNSHWAKHQLTKKQAKALFASKPWETEKWSYEKMARMQLTQKKLFMDFSAFHKAVEKALKRPVWTHEFAKPNLLWHEWQGKRLPPTMQEIIGMLPADKTIIAIV